MKKLILLLMLCGLAATVNAAIVELPLDCAGTYNKDTPTWQMDFDLGVQFSQIDHVYIDWAGTITGALVQYYHLGTFEPVGEPYPITVGIHTAIKASWQGTWSPWRHTDVWGGEGTYPEPEPFDQLSEFVYGTMSWSELYDGQGTIQIDYSLPILLNESYLEYGSATLTEATLIIYGTIIPEPATLMLISIGVIMFRKQHSKISHRSH